MSKTRIVVAALLLSLVVAPTYASDGQQDEWSLIGWLEEQISELCELIGDAVDDGGSDDSANSDLGPAGDPIG